MIFRNQDQIVRGPNGPEKFNQPGYADGRFSPAEQAPVCPSCAVQTKPTGGNDFEFRCQNCGAQFRQDGSQRQAHQHVLPMVLQPNVNRS
jgi:predicted RNA-binding Zn-ribbon protein involved in translation (DUF1610 family)